ncbi:MAG: hypothetical protein V2J55_01330 [Candidatus Competibacteraceae bacterium]|jgi:hypothetical protein|nr:hypothetical protein [Candidatus Competibacteraceae bacterium]
MSLVDNLRAETRQRRGKAVMSGTPGKESADPTTINKDEPSATQPPVDERDAVKEDHSSYCQYWVARLQAIQALPDEDRRIQLAKDIESAPPEYRPPAADQQLLKVAGQALPVEQVTGWLQMRAALPANADVLNPATAEHWLQHLAAPNATINAQEWTAHCQQVASEAESLGKNLNPTVLQAIQSHPQWAMGYLRCSGSKARLLEAMPQHDNPPDESKTPAETAPLSPLPAVPSGTPASPNAPVSPTGLAMGDVIGAALGGTIRAATTAAATAVGMTHNALKQTPQRWQTRLAEIQAKSHERTANHALDDLTKQATALHEHPGLSTFWQQVDHQAVSGQTTRAGVFQAMANEADHPLKERLATTMNADPMLANAIHQAYNTFDRLSTAWENCAAAYRKAGKTWAPSTDQVQRLQAASRDTPPIKDHAVLAEMAERLVNTLKQVYHAIKQGPRAAATSPASSPGQ